MKDELPLQQSDHDLIVSMVATNKLSQSTVLERIADVKTDIAELKGNFTSQIGIFDSRIRTLESLAISSNPAENLKKLEAHDEFINDYKSTHKDRNAMLGFLFSLLSLIMATIAAFTRITFH